MNFKIAALLAGIFFIIGILTLPDYGINWDTINHLPRGQAYLHYFLTGKKDFSDLEPFQLYYQKSNTLFIRTDLANNQAPKRSLYQSDATPFSWFMEHDGRGHPPLSDILSSIFNLVFFNILKLVNDVDSYRIYGIFLSASIISLIFFWASRVYGKFAGFISALSLSVYPLFFAESHFNSEKDIPETVYWSFFLYLIWYGLTKSSWRALLTSGVVFGLALGTKFNILFTPLVIIPWVLIYLLTNFKRKPDSLIHLLKKKFKLVLAAIVAPLLGFCIFVASWPYLWPDPIKRISTVLMFYKTIGLGEEKDPRFLGPLNINTYPIEWIVFTIPLVILFLFTIGLITALFKIRKEKDKASLLFLLWLIIPIARVTYPGTVVYGGIRQIMEYIPAVALFSGLGAAAFLNWGKGILGMLRLPKMLMYFFIILMFVPIILKIYQIHPNENVYFNPLIGGLAGARQKDFPSWGNSFGNAYRQGINWINENADRNSKVVFVFELSPNIPRIFVRSDLELQNANRSGFLMNGEYAMTLTSQGTEKRSYYDLYLEKFVNPKFQVVVDNVPILKVWKNSPDNLKTKLVESVIKDPLVMVESQGIKVELTRIVSLTRLEIEYSETNCGKLSLGYVEISKDDKTYQKLPGVLPRDWLVSILGEQPKDGKFIYPFAGVEGRFINLVLEPKNTCLKNIKSVRIFYLK